MKGGSSMKELQNIVIIVVAIVIIGMGFAFQKHSHNQDLYYLKQASKLIDKQLLHKITKLEQDIRILKANSWF